MKRLIRDIRDEIDATPGGSAWMFGVHCYAVDILSGYIDSRGLTIWDEAERIGKNNGLRIIGIPIKAP